MRLSVTHIILITILLLAALAVMFHWRNILGPLYIKVKGGKTITEVMDRIGPQKTPIIKEYFDTARAHYPPQRLLLIAYKKEKELFLLTKENNTYKHVRTWPILGASGGAGPKLREGDNQVPEGIYRITALNSNSRFHLSMRLNYPNEFDMKMARIDKRKNPGSDIYIHGKDASIGCLAMGDSAIEELFYLAAKTGIENIEVIILPGMNMEIEEESALPSWTPELYSILQKRLRETGFTPANNN